MKLFAHKRLRVGAQAPQVQLETLSGERVMLEEYWESSHLLLIFLRHLA